MLTIKAPPIPGLPTAGAPYDPRLKLIAEELKAVLRRHDVAGAAIALASDTHSEFLMTFPKWCGLRLEDRALHVHMSSKEPGAADATLHVLLALRDLCGRNFVVMDDVSKFVEKELARHGCTVEHRPLRYTPDYSDYEGPV